MGRSCRSAGGDPRSAGRQQDHGHHADPPHRRRQCTTTPRNPAPNLGEAARKPAPPSNQERRSVPFPTLLPSPPRRQRRRSSINTSVNPASKAAPTAIPQLPIPPP